MNNNEVVEKARSRPTHTRWTKENAEYIDRLHVERGYANKNMTVNEIVSEHRQWFREDRSRALEEVRRKMAAYHLRPKDLEV